MAANAHVLIAGAGIGGLTAALSLLRAGFDVDVYEQAPQLGEVGAGFQMSANGTRILYRLGLGDRIESVAWRPGGKEIRIWNSGQTWPLFDLGTESVALYGYPYLMFHRADLHRILVDAVRAEKADAIHTGCKCTGFDQDERGVALRMEGGAEARGDALIGADGVHSAIRAGLFGADEPQFAGVMAWRGVIPVDRLPAGLLPPLGANWVGPGGHIVHYFLRRGELLNFAGFRERDDWQVESWSTQGTVEECLADYDGWHEVIRTLIRNIETPYKWALMLREPMERWTQGRVTLLGDACHAMLPFLAQGAVQAIEDGCVLARCFAKYGAPEEALAAYETARRARANAAVTGSKETMQRFHNRRLADPAAAERYVNEQWQPDAVKQRYDWLFTYDATSVAV
jgi:salicylate hydroxylase